MSIGLWKRRRKKWKLGSFYWSKFRGAIQWQVALCAFRWCKESPTLFLPRGVPQGRAGKLWSVVSKMGMLNLKCGTREKQINASGCTLRQQHCPRKHSGKKYIFFAVWHETFLPMILKHHRGEPPSARTHTGQSQAWGETGQTHYREKTLLNVTQSVFTCGLKAKNWRSVFHEGKAKDAQMATSECGTRSRSCNQAEWAAEGCKCDIASSFQAINTSFF